MHFQLVPYRVSYKKGYQMTIKFSEWIRKSRSICVDRLFRSTKCFKIIFEREDKMRCRNRWPFAAFCIRNRFSFKKPKIIRVEDISGLKSSVMFPFRVYFQNSFSGFQKRQKPSRVNYSILCKNGKALWSEYFTKKNGTHAYAVGKLMKISL